MKKNDETITPEMLKGKRLLFFPKTVEEAEFIAQQLIKMEAAVEDGLNLSKCVTDGMVLKQGIIYTQPSAESRNTGYLCTSAQFEEKFTPPPTPYELMEKFNELSAKLDAIQALLEPKMLDKARPAAKKMEM